MLELLITILAGFATYMIYVGFWRRSQAAASTSAQLQRLRSFQAQSSLGQEILEAQTQSLQQKNILSQVGEQVVSTFLSGVSGQYMLNKIEEKLILSGRPHGWYAQDYIAFATLALGGTLVLGGLAVQAGVSGYFYLALVGLVCIYSWWELNGRISQRQEKARFELPYFIDELIMSLSSGSSSLDLVLRETLRPEDGPSSERRKERVLVQEFRQAYDETSTQARSFGEAYRAAAARIGVQPVSDLVEILTQGYETGAPIIGVLRDMSAYVYVQYEQDVSTLIKKKDSTFTIATVIIMLGAALVIGAPILNTVLRALSGGVTG